MIKTEVSLVVPAGIDQKKETALDQEKPLLSNGTTVYFFSQGGNC